MTASLRLRFAEPEKSSMPEKVLMKSIVVSEGANKQHHCGNDYPGETFQLSLKTAFLCRPTPLDKNAGGQGNRRVTSFSSGYCSRTLQVEGEKLMSFSPPPLLTAHLADSILGES